MSDEIKNMNDDLPQESSQPKTEVIPDNPANDTHVPAFDQKNIKPWLLILNLILLVALVILYILYFTGKGKGNDASMSQAVAKAKTGNMAVAFVNNDSIMLNYDLVKKLRKELEAKESRLASEISSKQAAFDKDASYFQDQVQKKSISDQSAQEIYANLTQNQQKINALRDQYSAELQQNEMNMNVALLDSIMNFLHRYNQKYKFDYILGFNKVGNILYANDTLDITKDVLKELNTEYNLRHPGK